jgi:TolB-like protein/Flp pilus assembly protein TadD
LSHPSIVTIHSVEQSQSRSGEEIHFLTMELVEGETLERLVPRDGLPIRRLFDIAIQVADALAAAHAKGITHRDLKPTNIMVSDAGRVKVLDFGLAKLTSVGIPSRATQAPTEAITREGTVLGTYPYMSPEQVEGKPLDPRTDIFSFGIVLYEMATGVRPFQGDTSAALISSILKDDAVPVESLKSNLPRHLGRIIRHCLEKQRNRRFQSALDLRNELATLRREVETEEASAEGHAAPVATAPRSKVMVATGLILVVALLVLVGRTLLREEPPPSAVSRPTVAVFPFQNLAADATIDYLGLAVPDEVTTTLSREPGLAVRPFSTSAAYRSEVFDPVAAGLAVSASNIVTGQYFLEGDRLQLTLEAIDVERNQVLWRERVSGSIDDLISLRSSVAEQVRDGLLPRLGGSAGSEGGTVPSHEEAYTLYLRSLALSSDIEPTRRAIAMLERAVELDPSYAPAWVELARRYYYEANFGLVGDEMYASAIAAAERSLALDPNLILAAFRMITIQAETGELQAAWDQARRLLEEHPDSAEAHHAMGYVLRYAGLVDEGLVECERALALDPTNPLFRLCGITAYLAGAYDRSEVFLMLDGASRVFVDNLAILRLREGRLPEALEVVRSLPDEAWHRSYLDLCLGEDDPEERDALGDTIEVGASGQLDGEQQYWSAAYMSYCGDQERALRLLRIGVEHGYCSFPLIDTDPLLAGVRQTAGFDEVRELARQCHERFLAHRASSEAGGA